MTKIQYKLLAFERYISKTKYMPFKTQLQNKKCFSRMVKTKKCKTKFKRLKQKI